ncbi:MAG: hypothetical protein SFW09_23995 [Hyphomicrobiaceae bacterium]|nr:hypothetical protein [Hyphomicrobiaceae bacterium]
MTRIALVRAPHTYRYNRTDVREEVILTQLAHYLSAVGIAYSVFDFHLARHLVADDVVSRDPSAVVIAVRETGDNVHYVLRLASYLTTQTQAPIFLYGQTARLLGHPRVPDRVRLVAHDEPTLARMLGIPTNGPIFSGALQLTPYAERDALEPWQQARLRGSIETSRGCPYPCEFCFINAGENHARRWQMQPVKSTIANLARYTDSGVNAFVLHDSEFLGGSRRDLANRIELVEAIRHDLPPVAFKIYARADTILRYPRLGELRDAGLVSVFIGAESLVQSDLDALGKELRVEAIDEAIARLADLGVYMDLSFILFNRATTTTTLRANLARIHALYMSRHARLLGMPHFTFSFESAWRSVSDRRLGTATYVGWDVRIKAPPTDGVAFDPTLEPLMEIYRLLAYEWSRKVVDLSLVRDAATDGERLHIERWFAGLGAFCADTMLQFLDLFERGALTQSTLPEAREQLFQSVSDYYRELPARLGDPATLECHAARIGYQGVVERVENDEYWTTQIPEMPAATGRSERSPS